ncbi:hypothetical protein [Paenibacillus gansuensis]|uniref:DUF3939 domain-containing protein n=1 Tax=Paenibacillus gansuensis TaxID=306542 RepID=A0ABW5PCH1_9BACL
MNTGLIRIAAVLALLILTVSITGCMYPDERRGENNPAAAKEFLVVVQNAVNEYQKETGLLPIQNSTMDTPLYEKYVVAFKLLQNRGFLSSIPANAFERGGTNYYIVINEETNPEVKLMDLVSYQQAEAVQKAVDDYRGTHGGVLPAASEAAKSFYWIDYKLLGTDPPKVVSVYTGQTLSLMMHETGRVVIDYAPDLMQLVQKQKIQPMQGKDMRALLAESFPHAPAKSYPYFWTQKEPRVSAK